MPYTVTKIDCSPWFDMELLLSLSQESRIGGDLMDKCMKLWKTWSDTMTVARIETGKRKYLLVRLDDSVEHTVDEAWEHRPSEGHTLNALAQALCMAVTHDLLPEVQEAGCAPAPKPTDELRDALEAQGVPYLGDGPTLSKRYAVLTHLPFKGGCEICTLLKDCPKGQGKAADAASSVLLPGFEPPAR